MVQCLDLGVGTACPGVESIAYDLIVLDDDGAHERIRTRRAQAPSGQLDGPVHEGFV
jgi:hypothetical protein